MFCSTGSQYEIVLFDWSIYQAAARHWKQSHGHCIPLCNSLHRIAFLLQIIRWPFFQFQPDGRHKCLMSCMIIFPLMLLPLRFECILLYFFISPFYPGKPVENKLSFTTATWPRPSKAVRQKQHRITHGINKRTVSKTIEKSVYNVCK